MAMSERGWAVADVHEIPPIQESWGDTWKSVRHHFGITAFGVNAVSKDEGEVLIPEHDESEANQQELFFVYEGEATAELDGQPMRAAAGSFIAIEPRVRRKFTAAVSPTTLIVVGAPIGQAFEISAWEKP
jgi:quercetin dioxygenase-like cupin family protein